MLVKRLSVCLVVFFFAFQLRASLMFSESEMDTLIESMTLEEKVALLSGVGMDLKGDEETFGSEPIAGEIRGKVDGAAGATQRIARLGIPSIILADGPAGLRISPTREHSDAFYYCTAFPIGTALASSWDVELLGEVGKAIGSEVKEYGVDVWLAPAMNLQRNPLAGRNFEYFSEDPVLTGKIAAAIVHGVQSCGVGASLKHFAVNSQETNRMAVDEVVNQRALREVYLKGFEIAVKQGKPWTVMTSYHRDNGVYTSESEDLLTHILRNEWGFDGMVMTDWFAGRDPVAQVRAGNDLLMPGRRNEPRKILKAIAAGELDVEIINRNVRNILGVIAKSPTFHGYRYSDTPELADHALISRRAAAEGMVLLKNENQALPVKDDAKIALFGTHAYATKIGGTGSGEVNEAYTVSIVDGIESSGLSIHVPLKQAYMSFVSLCVAATPERVSVLAPEMVLPELSISEEIATFAARENDVGIITIGRIAGEQRDRDLETQYYLNDNELQLIEKISTEFRKRNKPVVVVLNIDAMIDIASWHDKADAILVAWLPGQEAGHAVTDVINGKVNPSGKLTSTVPLRYKDVPSATTFPNRSDLREWPIAVHSEGIYVGYRYYSTFDVEVAYPFGFGLSYTDFEVGAPVFETIPTEEFAEFTVTVVNKGEVPGKEVVQIYKNAPAISMPKPVRELKAFAKTKLLQPGETQVLRFKISLPDLASFDDVRDVWVVEKGTTILRWEFLRRISQVPSSGRSETK